MGCRTLWPTGEHDHRVFVYGTSNLHAQGGGVGCLYGRGEEG